MVIDLTFITSLIFSASFICENIQTIRVEKQKNAKIAYLTGSNSETHLSLGGRMA